MTAGTWRARIAAAAVALAIVLCGARQPLAAQDAGKIVVILPPSVDVAPLLYADQAGLFVKAGLTVQILQMATGGGIAGAIAGGSGDIGFSSLPALIAAHAHGVPLALVAPGGIYHADDATPYAYMLVRKDSPVHTGRDLNGKTLGSAAVGDLDTVSGLAWMDTTGGSFRTAHVVEFPTPALPLALIDGRIDALSVGQPWVTVALDSGKVRVVGRSFSAIAPRFLMSAYFSTTAFASSHPDELAKFQRVVGDASAYVNAHHDAVIPILAAFTKQDPAMIARTMVGSDAQYLNAKDVQPVIDASARYGMIPAGFDARDMITDVRPAPANR